MHPTSHITPEMMKAVLDEAFGTSAAQADKNAARHLRNTLVSTHATYASVLFDVLEMAGERDKKSVAEMAFLVGMQAGHELGIAYPPPVGTD